MICDVRDSATRCDGYDDVLRYDARDVMIDM